MGKKQTSFVEEKVKSRETEGEHGENGTCY